MHRALILTAASALLFAGLLLSGCASPQALPAPPTAIPTLIPATMPPPPPLAAAPLAPGVPAPTQPAPAQPAAPAPAQPGAPVAAGNAAAGEQIFTANCTVCHTLTDETRVGPGLAILYRPDNQLPNGQPPTDENVVTWIHTGGGGMPGFPQIQGEQMASLLAYMKQATGAPSAPAAPAPSQPVTSTAGLTGTAATGPGADIFNTNCAVCHRLTNETVVGPGLAGLFLPENQLPNGTPPTDENLMTWLHQGGGGMPGFTTIQGEQMSQLLQFLHEATTGPGGPPAGLPVGAAPAVAPGQPVTAAHGVTVAVPASASVQPVTATQDVTMAAPALAPGQPVTAGQEMTAAEPPVASGQPVTTTEGVTAGVPVEPSTGQEVTGTQGVTAGVPAVPAGPAMAATITATVQVTGEVTTSPLGEVATALAMAGSTPAPPGAATPGSEMAQTAIAMSGVTPASPPVTAAPTMPAADTTSPAGAGADVFNPNCAVCHTLSNETLVGPGLAGVFSADNQLPDGQPVTDDNFIAYIQAGGNEHPGFAQIQGQQMDDLLAFLKATTRP